ncbi:MAG: aminotransferase class V-fold PLP-dependent enzyme [Gammaproteobacteria bacterium]|nr:aminotransferase class V-fold PLP-dependent enzyme [Gammaproteobacteria bacterium]
MNTSRRSFLRRSAGALALAPIVPVGRLASLGRRDGAGIEPGISTTDGRVPATAGSVSPQEAWVARARAEIPASTGSLYFQTGGIGPSPEAVIDHVRERLTFQNESPAEPRVATDMARIEPDLRAQLGRVFGAGADEVALTHSTSEGIAIVAWSLNWQPGDEVVISNTEHPANVIPWYVLRDRFGIVIREIDLSTGTGLVDQVRGQLSSRTRMVSISHVSRNNGRTLRTGESAELGALLRSRGVRYHLDGAQGPGCVPTDFRALGCDCYSTCGHKWLLGPKGTGALFVRREVLDEVRLSWAGSHSHATMDYEGAYTLLPSAARYEFGTRALADFAGFARAVEWMEGIGLARIEERIQSLVDHAIEAVDATDELGVSSPRTRPDRSGVFVLELPERCDATQLYNDLREDDGILASPVRQPRDFRLSIHFFNTRDEIDAAIAAIEARCG